MWRYQPLLPGGPDIERIDLGAGFTPLRRADNLAARLGLERLWIKDDSVNPSNSFKDRVVSVAIDDGARVRVRGDQLRIDRQPRERHRGARGEGRHALLRVRARRPRARQDPRDRGLRREGRRREGELRRGEPPVLRGRRGAAVGVREREHAAVLRRGVEVARVRDGRTARLAPARPRGGADRERRAAHEGAPRVPGADRDRRRRGQAVPRLAARSRRAAARSRRRSRTAPRPWRR